MAGLVSAGPRTGFFLGVDLPAELRISYPAWVQSGTDFEISCNAEGLTGGRVGLSVSARARLTFSAMAGTISISPIDVDKSLNLVAELSTPIGVSFSEILEDKVEIGSFTIPLIVTSLTVAAYLGVTASIALNGTLLSNFSATSSSLAEETHETILWDEKNETITKELSVRESVGQDIQFSLSDTKLRLDTYSVVVTSVFIEFIAGGYTFPKILLPIPYGLFGSIASGVLLDCEDSTTSVIHVYNPQPQQMEIPIGGIVLGIAGVLIVVVILTRLR